MKRTAAAALAVVLASGSLSATSAAAAPAEPGQRGGPPLRIVLNGTPEVEAGLTQACGTTVTSTARGHLLLRETFDADGRLVSVVAHPSLRQTLSSAYGSVTSDDRGLDRLTFDEEAGTVTIFGTGIHLRVKGGPKAIGLWRFVIDLDDGEVVSASYSGRFDLLQPEIGAYLCSQLGPPAARP